jgi:hypothetical protein
MLNRPPPSMFNSGRAPATAEMRVKFDICDSITLPYLMQQRYSPLVKK